MLKLHEPTSGRIVYDGTDITDYSRRQMQPLRRQMQMVFQDPQESLNGRHTIGTLLQEPFVIHKMGSWRERQTWAAELLERVGLPASALDRFPHEFSGGQRQRIGIARAMALNPRLLVCDEAVSALDVSVQSQILNLLLSLQQERGLAMLFIAHDLSVVKHVSDHIAVMYLGRIVEQAPAEELYRQPRHPYTQVLISAIPQPDPRARRKPIMLSGELPSPASPPSGCYFRTRCPYAGERCAQEVPMLQGNEHKVACHYAAEIASGTRQPCANMHSVTID